MPIVRKKIKVDEQTAGRADRAVQQALNMPRRQLRGLFEQGGVAINGTLCLQTFARVTPGDVIDVRLDPHQRYHAKAGPYQDPAFRIVHEDEHLLVVDKAPRALTVPSGDAGSGNSLVERLSAYLARSRGRRKAPRAWVVHRLDRGTSGLLVFAKSQKIAQLLKRQFAQHKPHRVYLAIVAGRPEPDAGTFRSHLATGANLDRYSAKPSQHSELAITHYETVRHAHGATLMRVQLETGRRNQIRVHFAEAGHPVLGDPRYRPELASHRRWVYRRLALHAAVLGFTHPISGQTLHFELPPPRAFDAFMA